VLLLDEPTTGLDPASRQDLWDVIAGLVADGTTVLLTTQYLEEADRLADRVALLDRGRVVAEGSPAELKRRAPGSHVRLRFADLEALELAAAHLPASSRDPERLTLAVPSDRAVRTVREVLGRLDALGVDVEELSVHEPDLDDVFLALTGPGAATAVTA